MKQALVIAPEDFEKMVHAVVKEIIRELNVSNYIVEKPMNRKQAAAFMGYSERRFDELVKAGKLRGAQVSGWSASDLLSLGISD